MTIYFSESWDWNENESELTLKNIAHNIVL